MNFTKFAFFLLVFILSGCEKNVEDNLAGHIWQYEATYSINNATQEVINVTGEFTFKDDFSGKQTESEIYHWDFNWSTSSKYVEIEYLEGGNLYYTIKVNEEKKQEWTASANYVYSDSTSFPASITMKLTRN